MTIDQAAALLIADAIKRIEDIMRQLNRLIENLLGHAIGKIGIKALGQPTLKAGGLAHGEQNLGGRRAICHVSTRSVQGLKSRLDAQGQSTHKFTKRYWFICKPPLFHPSQNEF